MDDECRKSFGRWWFTNKIASCNKGNSCFRLIPCLRTDPLTPRLLEKEIDERKVEVSNVISYKQKSFFKIIVSLQKFSFPEFFSSSTKIELYQTLYIISNDNACFLPRQKQPHKSTQECYQIQSETELSKFVVILFSISTSSPDHKCFEMAIRHHFSWELFCIQRVENPS